MSAKIIPWRRGATLHQAAPMVAVIGNFDGVHKGHQHLIATAKSLADDLSLPLGIVSFAPHPRSFFRPQDPPFLLMDQVQKQQVLFDCGASFIIEIAFDDELRIASPEAFAQEMLKPLNIVHLFAGEDFAFGKARAGSLEILAELGAAFDMRVSPVSLALDANHMVISSSRIRAALQAGQVTLASKMLTRPFALSGRVLQGDKRGRTIGFPTANIALTDQLHPAFGVYAISAKIGEGHDVRYCDGVANIGIRPTVNDRGVLAEAHLFDFQDDIYGQRIEIALQGYVRAEMKFENLDALRAQILKDTQTAKDLLAE